MAGKSPKEELPAQDFMGVMSNEDIIDMDPILAAEAKHGPVFRRELFNVAYDAYNSIMSAAPEEPDFNSWGKQNQLLRQKFTLLDINGDEFSAQVPRDGDVVQRREGPRILERVWGYASIQQLGHMYGDGVRHGLCPYTFIQIEREVDKSDCFKEEELLKHAPSWRKKWEKSDMFHHLTKFLNAHAGETMVHVDKIVCFGLGCLKAWQEKGGHRSYIQHLAACTIRDIFARIQGVAAPTIYAQDPGYCSAGKSYLAKHFDMTIVDDPEGFKMLDGNTFVLSFAPNVCVRQVAFGITHEFGGPAGFFCDSIDSEGLESNGKSGRDFPESPAICPYGTCESSPGLWKYKSESAWTEISDKDEEYLFGAVGIYLKKKGEHVKDGKGTHGQDSGGS
ncbi:hypothetical protein IQ07DRAFT_4808 [Pyrenochaeta sp. DS3sAY3a]|nr:hypothetical protein IQ07DRAFT_4808 [Pyrenochaeta sp. DS3sAY3a]